MSEAINYTARELLRDGSQIEIRALRREDEADMLAAVGKTSAQSLQRRFFVMKRHFSDKERAFFMDIDFKNHVAIVALAEEAGRKVIVGGGRYIVFEPGRAEMAFMVSRYLAGTRPRLDPDASSRQVRERCRAAGINGRSSARKRSDDKSIRKVRLQARRAPGPADTPSGAEARLETRIRYASLRPTSSPGASADSRYPGPHSCIRSCRYIPTRSASGLSGSSALF